MNIEETKKAIEVMQAYVMNIHHKSKMSQSKLEKTILLCHEDLYYLEKKSIKRMRSKILQGMKHLEIRVDDGSYSDEVLDSIQDEIDLRGENIEFIDNYLYDLEEG